MELKLPEPLSHAYVITGGTGKTLKVWSINESDMDFSHILGGKHTI